MTCDGGGSGEAKTEVTANSWVGLGQTVWGGGAERTMPAHLHQCGQETDAALISELADLEAAEVDLEGRARGPHEGPEDQHQSDDAQDHAQCGLDGPLQALD